MSIPPHIWQDREIRFDCRPTFLAPRKSEYIIDSINSVEDTKGNNGERGSLIVTNLRIIWVSHKKAKTNLSIGFQCVIGVSIKKAKSRMRGQTSALFLMTKFTNSRFEFIFTSLVTNSPRLFTTVQSVLRAYESTKLYRDLKLRGSIMKNQKLILLPHEEVYNTVPDTWNLSADQGNLGIFYITNIRLVWSAVLASNFNVSVPYMQMKSVREKDSAKFGRAVVVETRPESGGYVLGFRLGGGGGAELVKEIRSLHQVFSTNPIFGIDFSVEEKMDSVEALTVARVDDGYADDDESAFRDDDGGVDVFAAYFADGEARKELKEGEEGSTEVDGIAFDEDLGLAVQTIPGGMGTYDLWNLSDP